jgi:hypothetical protein
VSYALTIGQIPQNLAVLFAGLKLLVFVSAFSVWLPHHFGPGRP